MKKSDIQGRNTITVTRKRIIIISLAFLVFASYLIVNLFKLQILGYDYYKNKVYDQITTTTQLRAKRGSIYDTNMNLLATTNTEWRIFISTKDIKKAQKETEINYSKIISSGLSEILGLSASSLLEKIEKTNVLDITIKKSVSEEEYIKVLDFIKKIHLKSWFSPKRKVPDITPTKLLPHTF